MSTQFHPQTTKCLRRGDTVQLPGRTEAFDPNEFFQTRLGLYVWDDFRKWIVAAAKPIASVPAMQIALFDLLKPANDEVNRGELPEGHFFEDPSVFCAYLAGMLERQADGKDGDLITTGYANIFYVRSSSYELFTVFVLWGRDDWEWGVDAAPLYDNPWYPNRRTFSRSC